jgi:hypothetical protein
VALGLAGPPALLGVGLKRLDVGELVDQHRGELGGGDEVVALLADVGVGAGLLGEVAGAVAVRAGS